MAELDSLELLVKIQATGLENLKATQSSVQNLAQVVQQSSKQIDAITASIQAMGVGMKTTLGQITDAVVALAKQGAEQAAAANKRGVDQQIADNERLVRSYERRNQMAGLSGSARVAAGNANVLASFGGTPEQIDRLKNAMKGLEDAAGQSGRGFAQSIRSWITYPLYEAGKAAEAFLTSLGPVGVGVGAAIATFAALNAGFILLANSAARTELEFRNFSLRTGLSSQATQQFIAASKIAGVNAFALESSVRKLSEALADGGEEGKKTSAVLNQLGVNAYTAAGALRPMDEILPEIFRKLAAIPNEATRNTVALQLLGRSGRELIPLLGNLDTFMQKAKDLGLILGGEGTARLDKYGRAARELGVQFDAAKLKLGAFFAAVAEPDVTTLANLLAVAQGDFSVFGVHAKPIVKPIPAPDPNEASDFAKSLAANRDAKNFLSQDPARREKELQDKVNKLNETLEFFTSHPNVYQTANPLKPIGSPPESPQQIGTQRNQALAELAALKDAQHVREVILHLQEELVAASAKELFGEQKINEEYRKRQLAIDNDNKLTAAGRSQATFENLAIRGQQFANNDVELTTNRENLAAKRAQEIAATTARLQSLSAGLAGTRARGADLDPNSAFGINQRAAVEQTGAGAAAREALAGLPELQNKRAVEVARDNQKEVQNIDAQIAAIRIGAARELVTQLIGIEKVRVEAIGALDKKQAEEAAKARLEIATIGFETEKTIAQQNNREALREQLQQPGFRANPVAAATAARTTELANIQTELPGMIAKIDAATTIFDKQKQVAIAIGEIETQTNEANLKYNEQILELQKKRQGEEEAFAHTLAGALDTRGAARPFIREQAKAFETQVLGNALEPAVKNIGGNLSGGLGSSPLARQLFKGTPLAPDDSKDAPLIKNTTATDRNTDALIALIKLEAERLGVPVPGGIPGGGALPTSVPAAIGAPAPSAASTGAAVAAAQNPLTTAAWAGASGAAAGGAIGFGATELFNPGHKLYPTKLYGELGAGIGALGGLAANALGLGNTKYAGPGIKGGGVEPIVPLVQQSNNLLQEIVNNTSKTAASLDPSTSGPGANVNIESAGGQALSASVISSLTSTTPSGTGLPPVFTGAGAAIGSGALGALPGTPEATAATDNVANGMANALKGLTLNTNSVAAGGVPISPGAAADIASGTVGGIDIATGDTIGNVGATSIAQLPLGQASTNLSNILYGGGGYAAATSPQIGGLAGVASGFGLGTANLNNLYSGGATLGTAAAVGTGIAAGGAVIGGTLTAIQDFKKGGAKGALGGTSAILGTAAAVDPEPISKAILGIGALLTGIVGSLLGDPKQIYQNKLNEALTTDKYTAPAPISVSVDSSGMVSQTDFRGKERLVNATPLVSTYQQATGYDVYNPNDLITATQRRIGYTDVASAPAAPTVHVTVQTMDSKSFQDNAGNIATAVRTAMQQGHPINNEIVKTAKPR